LASFDEASNIWLALRCGKATDLSTDQRPSTSTELARIEQAGGFVEDGTAGHSSTSHLNLRRVCH